MGKSAKFEFGTSAKQQIARRMRTHASENFANDAKAAESLGISRQRLFSYTSGKTLPRAPVFDLIFEKWNLDLLGGRYPTDATKRKEASAGEPANTKQLSLFNRPITLRSDELKVVITRKGPRLVARIEIATEVEVA